MIIHRLLCLICGYVFGLLQTSYIYGRINGIDIREHGSGNAGTTNALRVLGKKAGLVVFIGDLFKAVFCILIVRTIMNNIDPNNVNVYILYAGFGVILGHNFPFYLKFKGGKGIAATAGIILGFFDPIIIISCLLAFTLIVLFTRYVSVGSIVILLIFFFEYMIFSLNGKYSFDLNDTHSYKCMIESIVIVGVIAAMGIFRHRANIKRLINHEENKIGNKKTA